jgi:ketosteroid isomerase-like protein
MIRAYFVLAAISLGVMQTADPQPLQRMVSTERAFAASAAELGVRDAFLTFFAEDAVQIAAGSDGPHATIRPAKAGLRTLSQPKLPLLARLMWEPFTGHMSSDGTFGWLTGGYANLSLMTKDVVGQGAYFSVWKHQADGTWRVWIDEGISLPSVWQDASPFRVAPEPDLGSAGGMVETIEVAERSVAAGGEAWQKRLGQDVRVHRDGKMPFVGREAAVDWARAAWQSVRFTVIKTEVAGSDDLGVALGGYDASPAEHGTWVRVWKRTHAGEWRIVFETSARAK